MKKMSQSALTKMVKERNLEVTRDKASIKPKAKEPEKTEKPDLASGIIIKSGDVVASMASSLAVSAGQVSESSVMIGKIAQEMQKESKAVPAAETPRKRKWKFTPVRNYDQIIEHIVVEEI